MTIDECRLDCCNRENCISFDHDSWGSADGTGDCWASATSWVAVPLIDFTTDQSHRWACEAIPPPPSPPSPPPSPPSPPSPPPAPMAPVCRVLIFRQTVEESGTSWLRDDEEWSVNPLNPSAAQFSILDQLEGMGRYPDGDNKILFELYWPELVGTTLGPGQLWKQSSNPVIGVPGAAVEGYEAVDAPYTGESWGGLQRNSDGEALLDGSTGSNWWYAVGSRSVHEGGIPGPGIVGSLTELYVHTPCASLSPPPPSSPPPSPSQPPPSPSPPPPPAWPPLPAKANELRISGRHTAIAFNTNVDGVEAFRCVGVGDRKLTCDGALHATDFVTLEGESLVGKLEEIRQHVGMVPPSTPPQTPPPSAPPTPPPVLYSAHYARVSFGQTPSRSAPGCPGHPETCGINFAFLGANGQRLAPASMFTEDATGWNCPVTALLFDGVGLPCGNCREPCAGLTGDWYGPLTVQMNFSVALSITGYDTNAIDSYSVAYSSDGVIWNQA